VVRVVVQRRHLHIVMVTVSKGLGISIICSPHT
jgi:hypothetical protein